MKKMCEKAFGLAIPAIIYANGASLVLIDDYMRNKHVAALNAICAVRRT